MAKKTRYRITIHFVSGREKSYIYDNEKTFRKELKGLDTRVLENCDEWISAFVQKDMIFFCNICFISNDEIKSNNDY